MSLNQLLNIRRPTTKLLVKLVSTVGNRKPVDFANQPARLGIGKPLVKNVNMISTDADADADQKGKTERDYCGPSFHGARCFLAGG